MPLLEGVVSESGRWRRIQTLVEAVLRLFCAVARRVAVYLDSGADSARLYAALLALLDLYANEQVSFIILDFSKDAKECSFQ